MIQDSAVTSEGGAPLKAPQWGWMLVAWMSLVAILHAIIWTTGVPDYRLVDAVEHGAARVEQQSVGEESADVIRKSIELQRNSLAFWTVITAMGDFVIAPLWIALRALAVTVTMCAVAAISGRRVRFPVMMADAVAWQGVWVFGLVFRAVLMFAMQRGDIDTSVVLLLPAREYGAREWVLLQQIDMFALIGWLGLAWTACRRGLANLYVALLACTVLALVEAQLIASGALLVNLGMRLALFPE